MFTKSPFDKYAIEYDLWYDRYKYVFYSELHAIKEFIPAKGLGIDIGAGTGRFASHLGIEVGVEPSVSMAQIAEGRGIKIIGTCVENIPLDDNQYDYALMVMTLCFLTNVDRGIIEICRILKPGGTIIIGFIDKDSPLGRHYEKTKHHRKFLKKATFFSSKQVADFLIDAGFGALEFRQTLFKPLEQITDLEPVLEGCDKGSYIVIKGIKN